MDVNKIRQIHSIIEEEDEILETIEEVISEPEYLPPPPENTSALDLSIDQKFSDGSEVLNGKYYKSYHFRPGNDLGKKTKGLIYTPTIEKLLIRHPVKDVREFKILVRTAGVEKLFNTMMDLEGRDFVTAMTAVMPYCMPKLGAVDGKSTDDIIDITDMQKQPHTIIIQNMRTGLTKNIIDD